MRMVAIIGTEKGGFLVRRTAIAVTGRARRVWDEILRFGTYLAPNILPVYQAITEAVRQLLGIATEHVVETSYESCQQDKNDVCFVCSPPYVESERRGIRAGSGFTSTLTSRSVVMPVVDSPEPDGMSVQDAVGVLRPRVNAGGAVWLELTIFDPHLDPDGSSARTIVSLLEQSLRSGGVTA